MKSIICLTLLAVGILAIDPPIFPDKYEVKFNETAKILTSGTTRGVMYLDAANNREVITRENGYHDRYCGSVYKFAQTPCNHYVINGI